MSALLGMASATGWLNVPTEPGLALNNAEGSTTYEMQLSKDSDTPHSQRRELQAYLPMWSGLIGQLLRAGKLLGWSQQSTVVIRTINRYLLGAV